MNPAQEQLLDGGRVMPVSGHLLELRRHLIRALLGWLIAFALCLAYCSEILLFLRRPLEAALGSSSEPVLYFTGPLDVFVVSLRVAALCAVVGSAPWWLWQFWAFFRPALYPRERRLVVPFTLFSVALFFGGVTFCYTLILPLALEFLLSLGREVSAPMITITDYVAMLHVMILGFGLVFEAPLLLVSLGLLGVVRAQGLAKVRRHVIVFIFILAAVMTPPDPMSQIGMAVPMVVMYEVAIVVLRLAERRRPGGR